MPTYDYACASCGHTFEEFQSMTSDPLKKCPKCKKNKLERLIGSGAGVIFKGSGFYETDYKRSGSKSDSSESSEKSASSDQSTSSGSDSSKSDSGSSSSASKSDT